jgi:hypothetical protein
MIESLILKYITSVYNNTYWKLLNNRKYKEKGKGQ